jgi:hypothetical protein
MSTPTIYTSLGWQALVGGLLVDNLGHDLSTSTFAVMVTATDRTPPSFGDPGWGAPTVNVAGSTPSQRTLQLLISTTNTPTPTGGPWYLWGKVLDTEKTPQCLSGPFLTA